jgi:hypothetical protein
MRGKDSWRNVLPLSNTTVEEVTTVPTFRHRSIDEGTRPLTELLFII